MLVLLYYGCHWYTLNLRNETLQDSKIVTWKYSTISPTVSSAIIGSILTDLEARRKLGMYAL